MTDKNKLWADAMQAYDKAIDSRYKDKVLKLLHDIVGYENFDVSIEKGLVKVRLYSQISYYETYEQAYFFLDWIHNGEETQERVNSANKQIVYPEHYQS